ncbi:MAG: PHP domain-containing protein [Anaerolineae bacterium]|jgi:hypothetical protein|nr:PHP domain-containing protein [Anaerolineae bacterium]
MREYRADLHIHTALSACAEVEMIPPLIVDEALSRGLDIIAITDHNATGNALAVREAATATGLTVLVGMELQTREEVDLLCIFDSQLALEAWQRAVDATIPPLLNDVDRFGPQFVVDREGNFVGEDPRLLQAPTTMGLEDAAREVHALGGLVIPAHIDRQHNGLMRTLGIWPPDLEADAAELSPNMRPSEARRQFSTLPPALTLISSSDAHWLEWMGTTMTIFQLDDTPSVGALRQALCGESGQRAYVP